MIIVVLQKKSTLGFKIGIPPIFLTKDRNEELSKDPNQKEVLEDDLFSEPPLLSRVAMLLGYTAGYHSSPILSREFYRLLEERSTMNIVDNDYPIRLFFAGLIRGANQRKYGIKRLPSPIIV